MGCYQSDRAYPSQSGRIRNRRKFLDCHDNPPRGIQHDQIEETRTPFTGSGQWTNPLPVSREAAEMLAPASPTAVTSMIWSLIHERVSKDLP